MVKRTLLWSIIFLHILFLLNGCTAQKEVTTETGNREQILNNITVNEANSLIKENKDNQSFFILDIRTPEEFNSGHIEGAINLDFYKEDFRDKLDQLDKDKKYLIYCRTANRSGQALEIMRDLGFTEVYNMLGGIVEWEKEGHPLIE